VNKANRSKQAIEESALKYAFKEVDLHNLEDSRTQQVLMVGANKKVLEIGPATGYITKSLRERGCDVTCVEIDAKAARIARKYASRMIRGDIETLDLTKALKGERYDVILFGDALEHLKNPSAILQRVRPYLKRSGTIVATIPNVAHGSVRLLLLDGNFDPQPTGLLDSTHLHYYTRKTTLELFSTSGYSAKIVKEIKAPITAAENLNLDLKRYPPELVSAIESDPNATINQFAVIARPTRKPIAEHKMGRRLPVSSKLNQPLTKPRTRDPLSVLLSVYYARPDLRAAYPEVRDSNYDRLVQWAAKAHEIDDRSATQLTKHAAWYRHGPISQLEHTRSELAAKQDIIAKLQSELLVRDDSIRKLQSELLVRDDSIRKLQSELLVRDDNITKLQSEREKLRVIEPSRPRPSPEVFYDAWIEENTPNARQVKDSIRSFLYKPKISIVMPVYNTEEPFLTEAIESVRQQLYENWELCICDNGSTEGHVKEVLQKSARSDKRIKIVTLSQSGGIAGGSNAALELADGEFTGFLDHDDVLYSNALFEVVRLLNEDPELDYIYSDEDKIDLNGRRVEPFFKPDWSPDLLLSVNYVSHLSVYRTNLLRSLGGLRDGYEGSQDYDLALRATEKTQKIRHISGVLYGWRESPRSTAGSEAVKPIAYVSAVKALQETMVRRGIEADVELLPIHRYRVRYAIKGQPLVTIIIPARTEKYIGKCVNSILQKTGYQNYEILVIDRTGSDISNALQSSEKVRIISDSSDFNFSRINMQAAMVARGDYLVFLNDDTEVISGEWLQAMLEHAQREEVGAVGAKLLRPNGTVQHAGIIVGIEGYATNYGGMAASDPGYFWLPAMIRNCAAVTDACMMVRKGYFVEMGGFDEALGHAWNDVDFGIRVVQSGRWVVCTPFALLYHYVGGTRGTEDVSPEELRAKGIFRKKNIEFIKRGDPFYNRNFSTDTPYLPRSTGLLLTPELLSDPQAALRLVYDSRRDLRATYPEAASGEWSNLYCWAAGTTEETDSHWRLLSRHQEWYKSKCEQVERVQRLEEHVSHLQSELLVRDDNITKLQSEREKLQSELFSVKGTFGFRLVRFYGPKIDRLCPEGTSRRKLKTLVSKSLRVIADEGLGSFFRKSRGRIARREFTVIEWPKLTEVFYEAWIRENTPNAIRLKDSIRRFVYKPKISIVMPVYNTEEQFLTEAIESVRKQYYEDWELCICDNGTTKSSVKELLKSASQRDRRIRLTTLAINKGIAGGTNSALGLVTGEFTGFLDSDDILYPNALFEVVKRLNENPELDYMYSDEDKIDPTGKRIEAFFKPDWSPDFLLSGNYVTHFSVYRTSLLRSLGGLRDGYEGSQDYDLVLRCTEETEKIGHLANVLYGWRESPTSTAGSEIARPISSISAVKALEDAMSRRAIRAHVEMVPPHRYRVRYAIKGQPLVTIIIPARTEKYIGKCVNSILQKTGYQNYEILVIDRTGSDISKTLQSSEKVRIIVDSSDYNFSRMNNQAARVARGEYLVFLNDDTEVISEEWLSAMLEHAQREEVGAVGAKLLHANGTVQHAGTIVGIHGLATNYEGMSASHHGYFALASMIRNCAAVTAACLMTRRKLFFELGGFDESLGHSWNDVDFGIRVVQSGRWVVYTPFALLHHYVGGTRGARDSSPEEMRAQQICREKHLEFIRQGDPFYNPNLSTELPYFPKCDLRTISEIGTPKDILRCVYESRPDLKDAYPEASNGDYANLYRWAASINEDTDPHWRLLSKHQEWYQSKCQ